MGLQELNFTFTPKGEYTSIPKSWSHSGVVGSGDMEVLLTHVTQAGKVTVKVVTPVSGFDEIWEKVLTRFLEENRIGDVSVEINDNNSTPFIVLTRLKQALLEAKGDE